MSEAISHDAQLAQKLHSVMKKVEYLQKDGKNKFHDYKYASEAVIKRAYRQAFLDCGVSFGMDVVDVQEREVVRKAKGQDKPNTLATVRIACTFTDIETGHSVQRTGFGQGLDDQDKAIYKGITGALKYVITGNFLTPTGDDPEVPSEYDEEGSKPQQSPQQPDHAQVARSMFVEACEKYGVSSEVMQKALEGSLQVDDLKAAEPEAIIAKLNLLGRMPKDKAVALINERAGVDRKWEDMELMEQLVAVGSKVGDLGAVKRYLARHVFNGDTKIPMKSQDASDVLLLIYEMSDDNAREFVTTGLEDKEAA